MNNSDDKEIAIRVYGICKSFKTIKAVNDLNLNIRSGCIFGFLGANGSGKSTSLRLLCGLLEPDEGIGSCFNFDLFKERQAIQSLVGYMPQKFSLYQNLTVYENLDFIARIYNVKDRKRKLSDIIELFSFAGRQDQLAHTLSGGWQQRLSLAAAILHEPRLLILDEPTSGVDPNSRLIIWSFIHDLAKKGSTILISTHHMDEAERCHELAYLSCGKILSYGTVNEVIQSAGLLTWRITGPQLPVLVSKLNKYHERFQLIEKGHELRLTGHKKDAIRDIQAELSSDQQLHQTETSLEDVFIFKIRHEEKAHD